MNSDAARSVGEEAVEAGTMNAGKMADDDSDVNMMKGLEYAMKLTFSLTIRER